MDLPSAMDPAPRLPLPLAELPTSLHRMCNPKAQLKGRMAAAKGLIPVAGNDQVTMLAQLSADENEGVQKAAMATLLDCFRLGRCRRGGHYELNAG